MEIRDWFPILRKNDSLVYLDSAATTQKPVTVIDGMNDFYSETNANVHRGLYNLSIKATEHYEEAREVVADFIGADKEEIIFTSGATESLNVLAYSIMSLIDDEDRDEILLTEMEHHSNLVPWQKLAERTGMKLKFVKVKDNYELDYEDLRKKLTYRTAVISFSGMSNVSGYLSDIDEICKYANSKGVLSIVDASQLIVHSPVNVKHIDCDFMVFSGHKIYGGMGIGVLYGKKKLLNHMEPAFYGGEMISRVGLRSSDWNDLPHKFEAGTKNIAGAISIMEAIKFLTNEEIKMKRDEIRLRDYALDKLNKIDKLKIYGHESDSFGPIISFNIEGLHCHDVASILDDDEIAIRAGHHCCMPFMERMKIPGTCRISFGVYNTTEDIDKLVDSLKKIVEDLA
jgi:cysteine desulfurase/selenocysteine lyase